MAFSLWCGIASKLHGTDAVGLGPHPESDSASSYMGCWVWVSWLLLGFTIHMLRSVIHIPYFSYFFLNFK